MNCMLANCSPFIRGRLDYRLSSTTATPFFERLLATLKSTPYCSLTPKGRSLKLGMRSLYEMGVFGFIH